MDKKLSAYFDFLLFHMVDSIDCMTVVVLKKEKELICNKNYVFSFIKHSRLVLHKNDVFKYYCVELYVKITYLE